MRLVVIQTSPRSTTVVEGTDLGVPQHDGRRRPTGLEDAETSSGCPVNTTSRPADCTADVKPMHQLPGPTGWPIVGNFLTYLKKENQGKMHEVQVSATL